MKNKKTTEMNPEKVSGKNSKLKEMLEEAKKKSTDSREKAKIKKIKKKFEEEEKKKK